MSAFGLGAAAAEAAPHRCPGAGCSATVRADRLCCDRCWLRIPLGLRVRIGQLVDDGHMGSLEHTLALSDAITYLRDARNLG